MPETIAKKILIVEDSKELMLGLATLLKSQGYLIVAAYDSLFGISLAHKEKPDLVILDIMMPQMDGYTFVEEMKNIKDVSPVPVIVLTVREGIHKLLDKKIVVEYIVKPYDEVVLLKKIKEHLKIN